MMDVHWVDAAIDDMHRAAEEEEQEDPYVVILVEEYKHLRQLESAVNKFFHLPSPWVANEAKEMFQILGKLDQMRTYEWEHDEKYVVRGY